jgi:membrane dipeptidase
MHKVFDGHNDVLLRLWQKHSPSAVDDFVKGDGQGQMDLPRMLAGGFAGGFFAIFVPNPDDPPHDEDDPNPPPAGEVKTPAALGPALAMAAILHRIARAVPEQFSVCRSVAEIRSAIAGGRVAAIMHVEGAECIDANFEALDVLHAAGLRSLGPVWSRTNIFGHGVPFRFPSSPDTGPGLTDLGRELVRQCNARNILVDLSHITEKGFWDVAKVSSAPLVATHSNAHALSASSRNLSDGQIRAVGESGGMIGLNFANGFLRADGRWTSENGLDSMMRHLDHLMNLAGEDHVGLGSDFDGARIPAQIGDVAGLPRLTAAMAAHGYGDRLMAKLTHENWLTVLERTWGSTPA